MFQLKKKYIYIFILTKRHCKVMISPFSEYFIRLYQLVDMAPKPKRFGCLSPVARFAWTVVGFAQLRNFHMCVCTRVCTTYIHKFMACLPYNLNQISLLLCVLSLTGLEEFTVLYVFVLSTQHLGKHSALRTSQLRYHSVLRKTLRTFVVKVALCIQDNTLYLE